MRQCTEEKHPVPFQNAASSNRRTDVKVSEAARYLRAPDWSVFPEVDVPKHSAPIEGPGNRLLRMAGERKCFRGAESVAMDRKNQTSCAKETSALRKNGTSIKMLLQNLLSFHRHSSWPYYLF
jgi:hypothetical protein